MARIFKIFIIFLLLASIGFAGYFTKSCFQKNEIVSVLFFLDGENLNFQNTTLLMRYNSKNHYLSIINFTTFQKKKKRKISFNEKFEILKKNISENYGYEVDNYVHLDKKSFGEISYLLTKVNIEERMVSNEIVEDKFLHDDVVYQKRMQLKLFSVFFKAVKIKSPFLRMKFWLTFINKVHTNLSMWDLVWIWKEFKYLDAENINMVNDLGDEKIENKRLLKKVLKNIDSLNIDKKIRVEVLNASGKSGYALKIARVLRKGGVDVYKWGNYYRKLNSILVLDRVGNFNNARKIAKILKTNDIFTEIDKSRFVDISVILGR
ncbi:LytR C-terminal domain-containing protein [bacterium]